MELYFSELSTRTSLSPVWWSRARVDGKRLSGLCVVGGFRRHFDCTMLRHVQLNVRIADTP